MAIKSIIDNGNSGMLIDIECSLSNNLPGIVIVGFANKAVDEARERIRSAFNSSGIPLPKKKITINLAPAEIPKHETIFDLGIAVSILESAQMVKPLKNTAFIGELGLNGDVHGARGLIGKLIIAKTKGVQTVYIPAINADQARIYRGISIKPVNNLAELFGDLTDIEPIKALRYEPLVVDQVDNQLDIGSVVGQFQAKRVLEIAAAGGHNVMLNGPPGTGKSMLAKSMISLLPPMSEDEILEVTNLHSLASLDFEKLITHRPVRSPHHSSSDVAIIGGGRNAKPGEISLAHRGILFMDEFPEFKRPAIEALRQPLEDGQIRISRANTSTLLPAKFILVATSNPCPCGYFGTHRECSCLPAQLSRYKQKLSGPIIDRIDLFTNVENIEHSKLLQKTDTKNGSRQIRQRVIKARERQRNRLRNSELNSDMTNEQLKTLAKLQPAAKVLLETAAKKLELSPRSFIRTIRVARTIADLDEKIEIKEGHISEALQYRPSIRNYFE